MEIWVRNVLEYSKLLLIVKFMQLKEALVARIKI